VDGKPKMQLSGFMESIVSRSDQRRFGPFFKRGKLERGIGEAFSLGPTCRHSLESGEDRIGFLPTGSFFGHQPPSPETRRLFHIFENRAYLDSKIGSMLARSAGEWKSNFKVNAAVRVVESRSCLDRAVSVSLQ
jgi:hypothetical protein